MDPLVSVLMPCYNASETLPLALASIRAQTYQNWECILVDDGSSEPCAEIAERFEDPRIRYFQHSRNLGRSAARQTSVDKARGTFFTMVDADDWIYPDKLRNQVEILRGQPNLFVLSSTMGIVDRMGRLKGVRGPRSNKAIIFGRHTAGSPLPISFAPSMFRAELAAGIRFNSRFRSAEDIDYLGRIAAGREYAMSADIEYVYTEYRSSTLRKALSCNQFTCDMYLSYKGRFPVKSRYLALKTRAKAPLYVVADKLGLWDFIIRMRNRTPTADQVIGFQRAAEIVERELQRTFSSALPGR